MVPYCICELTKSKGVKNLIGEFDQKGQWLMTRAILGLYPKPLQSKREIYFTKLNQSKVYNALSIYENSENKYIISLFKLGAQIN